MLECGSAVGLCPKFWLTNINYLKLSFDKGFAVNCREYCSKNRIFVECDFFFETESNRFILTAGCKVDFFPYIWWECKHSMAVPDVDVLSMLGMFQHFASKRKTLRHAKCITFVGGCCWVDTILFAICSPFAQSMKIKSVESQKFPHACVSTEQRVWKQTYFFN